MMSDYKILENHNIYNLQTLVNKKMSDGYLPTGGPFVVDEIETNNSDRNDYFVIEVRTTKRKYCQAVYRP
jgi:hypothetical protein